MIVAVIGLGLIGGSMAIESRKSAEVTKILGVDHHPQHAQEALELGLVDEIVSIDQLGVADQVIVSIPVNRIGEVVMQVLDVLHPEAWVMDSGSTKAATCRLVDTHSKRNQYLAAHPIAGTENSGPSAAHEGLFAGKTNIICDHEKTDSRFFEHAQAFFSLLGMKSVFMNAEDHDKHVAYVSHLSHVSSFLLGQTVMDIEKDERNIFALAGSGFESTVRLAKSSPDMWAPIFEQNTEHLGRALQEYIMHLQKFQYLLMKKDTQALHQLMSEANKIRPVLQGIALQNGSKEAKSTQYAKMGLDIDS
ncbi:MAG: prephenate dehydrogenase [Cyclobacteriaceae bacterium]|nr:prephenate dehydrogenase [Cyclobacteriaceae bacterium]MCH8516500.1 prephenate dehydrogenase [Cyclobacteriaceae bacterium]